MKKGTETILRGVFFFISDEKTKNKKNAQVSAGKKKKKKLPKNKQCGVPLATVYFIFFIFYRLLTL